MKWFRERITHGSKLALFALAIQLVLSFGHFHANAAPADATTVSVQLPANSDPAPGSSHHPADDGCAICAVMAMAGSVLLATPPVLLLPQAAEFLQVATEAEFAHLDAIHGAFQPRGPPLS